MDELFKKYAAAFDAFDAEGIAGLYRLPCAISDADGVTVFSDVSRLASKFSKNCDSMKDFGYQRALFNIISMQMLGENGCAVTIGWRVETNQSNIDFRTLYVCHNVDGDWLIFNANVYQGSFENDI